MRRALLIAVSNYDQKIGRLAAPLNDIAALKDVLSDPDLGGFDVVTIPNPTRQQMEEAIYSFFQSLKRDDFALLYFSGHGITDDLGKLYLAPINVNKNSDGLIKPTAVSSAWILETLRESRSAQQVVIMDCCFSGAFADQYTGKGLEIDIGKQIGGTDVPISPADRDDLAGRVTLSSSSAVQRSLEDKSKKLSLYTSLLVEGIRTGKADQDQDGRIEASELHDFVKGELAKRRPDLAPKIYPWGEGYRLKVANARRFPPEASPAVSLNINQSRLLSQRTLVTESNLPRIGGIESHPLIIEALRWMRYLYLMRLSVMLWIFPLLLVWANSPEVARSILSGVMTPSSMMQYAVNSSSLISASCVSLIMARIVIINGKERFGSDPPRILLWLLANDSAKCEWVAPMAAQLNNLVLFIYFLHNGYNEGLAACNIAIGLALGAGLAFLFWYALNACYYLAYQPTGGGDPARPLGTSAARTILFPRAFLFLTPDRGGTKFGDALERARAPDALSLLRFIVRGAGYSWPTGEVYEAQKLSVALMIASVALYLALWPLSAPVLVPGADTFVAFVAFALQVVAFLAFLFSIKPGKQNDRNKLRLWKAFLALVILGCALTFSLLSFRGVAEQFPVLALVLIAIISAALMLGQLTYFADRYRYPVLSFLFLCALIPHLFHWGGSHDESYLSISLRAQGTVLPHPAEILEHKLMEFPNQPVIVVAAAGGGIHAAAWTAIILEHLEGIFQSNPRTSSLHQHILLLSTSSGASSGLYSYLRELDPRTNGGRPDWTRMMLSVECSSMEAIGWALVYHDIPAMINPLDYLFERPSSGIGDLNGTPLGKDRGWALRRALSRNLNHPSCRSAYFKTNIISHAELLQKRQVNQDVQNQLTIADLVPLSESIPAFAINTTMEGERFLLASYENVDQQSGQLPYAKSFLQIYGKAAPGSARFPDLPLATAAELSAAIPPVMPSSRLPNLNGDEFSGASSYLGAHFFSAGEDNDDDVATAVEFLREALNGVPPGNPPVRVLFIEIRDSPNPKTVQENVAADRRSLSDLGQIYQDRLRLREFEIDDSFYFMNVHVEHLSWSLTPSQQQEVVNSASLVQNSTKFRQIVQAFLSNDSAWNQK